MGIGPTTYYTLTDKSFFHWILSQTADFDHFENVHSCDLEKRKF